MGTQAQDADLPTPEAPLVLAGGESVNLAWSLPPKPKPDTVIIYRTLFGGANFVEVARVGASELRYVDDKVTLGKTYQYRIQIARGANTSAMSEASEITVGGTSRITFLGGANDRALFEIVMFRRGRRISAQFVTKPGDAVGDLAYVEDLDTIEDFRLGPSLQEITLGVAESRENVTNTLIGPDGEMITDLAGRPVKVEFEFPGATHEVAIATLKLADGKTMQLKEGETFKAE